MRPAKPWLRKSTGTWHVQIDGRQRYLGKDRDKAFEKFRQLMQSPDTSDMTVHAVIKAYWKWCKANLATSTCERRETILESFCQSVRPKLKASSLRAFHVQDWIDGENKKQAKGKSLSPTTVGDYITRIKAAYNWALGMGYIETNPIAAMPKPSARIRQDFLPADTWPKVLQLATDKSFRDYLTVMLSSGCRAQEMVKFEAKHIDGKSFVLPIANSKGRKRSRVVHLPDDALAIVQRLAKEYPTGKLFRNSKGNPWNKDSIRCRFRRLKRELEMPELTATTLRHSFAHYRLSSGQDALTVSKLMGHNDTRMVATRYGHLEANAEYMNAAANAISFPALPMPLPSQTV